MGTASRGLVPTMGALHAGHLALIARAAEDNHLTVVSVFVNPTQFHDPGDLASYPRTLVQDVRDASMAGADLVFAPEVTTMYPSGFATSVEVGALATRWEGAARPGHFRGVATVVTILLNLVAPDRSYFGEKDFQQLQIIRRIHTDLALPGTIVGFPTVRDPDGLALSSRNERLSPAARTMAHAIPDALLVAQAQVDAGVRDVSRLQSDARASIAAAGLVVDYAAIVDDATLEPLETLQPGARFLVAAEIEGVRLIDNIALRSDGRGDLS